MRACYGKNYPIHATETVCGRLDSEQLAGLEIMTFDELKRSNIATLFFAPVCECACVCASCFAKRNTVNEQTYSTRNTRVHTHARTHKALDFQSRLRMNIHGVEWWNSRRLDCGVVDDMSRNPATVGARKDSRNGLMNVIDLYHARGGTERLKEDAVNMESEAGNMEGVWLEANDPLTNRPYYYHRDSHEVAWKRPKGSVLKCRASGNE